MDLPDQLQKQIMQHQQLQQQGELVATQRAQIEMAVREYQQTLKELEKLSGEPALYRTMGAVMIKVNSKEELASQLSDELETSELRIKSLKGQEDIVKEQLQKLQEQIQGQINQLRDQTAPGAGGPLGS